MLETDDIVIRKLELNMAILRKEYELAQQCLREELISAAKNRMGEIVICLDVILNDPNLALSVELKQEALKLGAEKLELECYIYGIC